jgi:hypothetical protein
MKGLFAFPLLLAAASIAPAAPTVEAATGDWSKLPQLSQHGYSHLDEKMQAKLFEIADSKQCPSFTLTQGRLDLKLSFATEYDTAGALSKVVLPQLNCAEAEGVLAGAVLGMLEGGDYAPTGQSRNGWYQGTIAFSFAGEAAREPAVAQTKAQPGAVTSVDPNEVVCEKVEQIGTRLGSARTCMTRAQWAEQKRLNRQDIEKIQTQRPCKDTC